jgi:protein ImuB
VERLYGGVSAALKRALSCLKAWDASAGAADRRFAALAAAAIARPGQALIVSDEKAKEFLAPLPLTLLPLEEGRREELERLGVKKIGQLAGLPGAAVAERLGPDGRRAHSLARGEDTTKVRARRPPAEIAERLEFPEAVGNELTLRRALAALLDRILARSERGGREIRKVALSARLVGGGSWRRTVTLREPSAERGVLRAALGPKLAELPAPVLTLGLELLSLSESAGHQLALGRPEGDERSSRLREGLRQVRASAGAGAVAGVVEVAPWSRIPEQRALLVPRD